MAKQNLFLVNGKLKSMKPECTLEGLKAKYPAHSFLKVKGQQPSVAKLENYMSDGVCPATDGCRVEPDGVCQHGHPSWLLALNII